MSESEFAPCVLAMGVFDGVHLGHAALMRRCVSIGNENGWEPSVMTFDTHPDNLVSGTATPLICSVSERCRIIREQSGIRQIHVLEFTDETRRIPWDVFLENVRTTWNVRAFVVGTDFRFGYMGAGNARLLSEWCAAKGIGCEIIDTVMLEGEPVSSTRIRKYLTEGNIEAACRCMGHPYFVTDIVRHGKQLGRTIGTPTINMQLPDGILMPRLGVYAGRLEIDDRIYGTVTNIGCRPTIDDGDRITVESYILNFSGDLYGRELRLQLTDFLRPEMKFASLDALSAQIAEDVRKAGALMEE